MYVYRSCKPKDRQYNDRQNVRQYKDRQYNDQQKETHIHTMINKTLHRQL
jgi:hypothetical protein